MQGTKKKRQRSLPKDIVFDDDSSDEEGDIATFNAKLAANRGRVEPLADASENSSLSDNETSTEEDESERDREKERTLKKAYVNSKVTKLKAQLDALKEPVDEEDGSENESDSVKE